MGNAKINERLDIDMALAPVAAGADGQTSSWFSMSGVGRVRAEAFFSETTATTATLALMQATDAEGNDAKTLSSADDVGTDDTTAESVKLATEVEVGELDLANDFSHVAIRVTYGSSDYVSAALMRGDLSYRPPS